MAILNYTTQIKTEKTVMEIEQKLAKAGASVILKDYDPNGLVIAISFRIQAADMGLISFRLPANLDGVLQALENDSNVPRRLVTEEQAARVAWRIIKDWVEAQLAIIEAEIAELPQVFLPYAQTIDGKTVYELMQDNKFKQMLLQ